MIKNYLKIALKVFLRKKSFTVINLLGISVTLVILTVVTAIIDTEISGKAPETKLERTLFVSKIVLSKDGRKGDKSGMSLPFAEKYLKSISSAEKVSLFAKQRFAITQNSVQRIYEKKFVDAEFWQILDFYFIKGRPFGTASVQNAEKVAVINREFSEHYFGTTDVENKTISLQGERYHVIGVVENVPFKSYSAVADVWVPYTTDTRPDPTAITGNYEAMILAPSAAVMEKIKHEFQENLKKVMVTGPEGYDRIAGFANTRLESSVMSSSNGEPQVGLTLAIIFILVILFMLIPTLNLVNLNITRMAERSSEIAIRRSFGASSLVLVGQFLFENLVLTLVGGLIGFLLSIVVLELFSDFIVNPDPLRTFTHGEIQMNFKVFLYCIVTYLFFGLFSGVYPAYRMSRMNIVEALKGGDQ